MLFLFLFSNYLRTLSTYLLYGHYLTQPLLKPRSLPILYLYIYLYFMLTLPKSDSLITFSIPTSIIPPDHTIP